jgi:hypothetical protein
VRLPDYVIFLAITFIAANISNRIIAKSYKKFWLKLRVIAPAVAAKLRSSEVRFNKRIELHRYIWTREYRSIGDDELTRLGNQVRRSRMLSSICIALILEIFFILKLSRL